MECRLLNYIGFYGRNPSCTLFDPTLSVLYKYRKPHENQSREAVSTINVNTKDGVKCELKVMISL